MKKLVAFAMILAIGLFTAVGCGKTETKKKTEEKKVEQKADGGKAVDTKTVTEEKK